MAMRAIAAPLRPMRARLLPPLPALAALVAALLSACSSEQAPTGSSTERPLFNHAPGHLVVNSLADPGDGVCNASQCTLREAINNPASREISFSVSGTITLAPPRAGGGELVIDQNLSISAASGRRVTIQRAATDPQFRIVKIAPRVTVTLSHLTLRGGKVGDFANGGGILNDGTLTLRYSTVSGNSAANGGGLFNQSTGSLTLQNSTVSGNSAARFGGAIANNQGTLTVIKSTIAHNTANEAGGAIDNFSGPVTLTNSTVSGNTARSAGGGILNFFGTLTLTNSTLSGNSAAAEGGGIVNSEFSVLTLRNALVARNTAPASPDIHTDQTSSITARYSLIGNGRGSGLEGRHGVNGNQVGTSTAPIDPKLGPLQNNGGPTQTHALLSGSPAIDAASNADCPDTDQRGVTRPQPTGGTCDIGSYERVQERTEPITYSGRATALQARGLITVTLADAGPLPPQGGRDRETVLNANVPGLLNADVLSAQTAAGPLADLPNVSGSRAEVADIVLTVGLVTIRAEVLASNASAECQDGRVVLSGNSRIVGLRINGNLVTVTGAPNQTIDVGLVRLVINEQRRTSDAITVNALHVTLLNILNVVLEDVVVSHAKSGIFCGGDGP